MLYNWRSFTAQQIGEILYNSAFSYYTIVKNVYNIIL